MAVGEIRVFADRSHVRLDRMRRAPEIFEIDLMRASTNAAEAGSPERVGPIAAAPLLVRSSLLRIEALAERVLAELVVERAFARVRERLVGTVDLLEFGLRVLISGVLVRMEIARELPIRLLDRIGLRVLGHSKNRVKVVRHHAFFPRANPGSLEERT